jgi:hypothetical protein
MSLVIDWVSNLSPSLLWTVGIILFIVLTEVWFVWFCKNFKRTESLLTFTIAGKFIAGFLSIVSMIAMFELACLVELIITYGKELLFVFGIVGIVVLFIGINYLIASKYSKEAKNENNFKKGDKLRAIEEHETDSEDEKTLSKKFTYKFIENKGKGLIEVECLDKRSTWYKQTRIFDEECFKKK